MLVPFGGMRAGEEPARVDEGSGMVRQKEI